MQRLIIALSLFPLFACTAAAREGLFVASPERTFQLRLTGSLLSEVLAFDEDPPGLLISDDEVFLHPRLTTNFDAFAWDWLSGRIRLRADRGLDPGLEPDGEVRLDEYFLRFDYGEHRLRLGKFASIFGAWIRRSQPGDSPFLNAPPAYENVTILFDERIFPDADTWLNARNRPDVKEAWLTTVWLQNYTLGAALEGRIQGIRYGLALKNRALASREETWDDTDFDAPTLTGRLSWKYGKWAFGTSASIGAYLQDSVEDDLPVGADVDDFEQQTLGADFRWKHEQWTLFGEWVYSRFDVPNIDTVDTSIWSLEANVDLSAASFAGLRWSQQFFSDVSTTEGRRPWDRDLLRLEAALGHRFTRQFQLRLQYSYQDQQGSLDQGRHFGGLQGLLLF